LDSSYCASKAPCRPGDFDGTIRFALSALAVVSSSC